MIRGGFTVARRLVGQRFVARQPVVMAALLALLLAGGCAAGGDPTTAEAEAGHAGDPAIAAQDLAFDRSELVVPAGRAFSLTFDNQDSASHNVSIADATGSVVFAGEIFSGPAIRRYAVPALEAGRYAFRCDVHPGMAGVVLASSPSAVRGANGR
jgi:plastocyanin